jgi:hypothetical protein
VGSNRDRWYSQSKGVEELLISDRVTVSVFCTLIAKDAPVTM